MLCETDLVLAGLMWWQMNKKEQVLDLWSSLRCFMNYRVALKQS